MVADFTAKHLGSVILPVVRLASHTLMATTISVYSVQNSYLVDT